MRETQEIPLAHSDIERTEPIQSKQAEPGHEFTGEGVGEIRWGGVGVTILYPGLPGRWLDTRGGGVVRLQSEAAGVLGSKEAAGGRRVELHGIIPLGLMPRLLLYQRPPVQLASGRGPRLFSRPDN